MTAALRDQPGANVLRHEPSIVVSSAAEDVMLFDVHLAIRSLQRQPGLSAALILTVGLAIAANTALFSDLGS